MGYAFHRNAKNKKKPVKKTACYGKSSSSACVISAGIIIPGFDFSAFSCSDPVQDYHPTQSLQGNSCKIEIPELASAVQGSGIKNYVIVNMGLIRMSGYDKSMLTLNLKYRYYRNR